MTEKLSIIINNNTEYINIPFSTIKNVTHNELEDTINYIIDILDKHNFGFPFKKYFMNDPSYYYNNIFNINISLHEGYFKFKNIIPKMGFELFEKIFHYTFDKKYLYIADNQNIYDKVNILTDFFTEKPRIESVGHGENISPFDYWNKYRRNIIKFVINKQQDINAFNLREVIYNSVTEARMGKISQYYTLLHFFKVRKFLDPSCAWGDRLIAAIAYNCDYYLGIDPNIDLKQGHDMILNTFSPTSAHKFSIIYEQFELVNVSTKFDFILSSPAPFEGDIYGNKNGQSIENYKDFKSWFLNYMFPTCFNSYNVLENNGHFLITILDRLYPHKYAIVELLLLTILYSCDKLFYKGVIAWEASKNKMVPFWVFKRMDECNSLDKKTFSEKALTEYYSDMFSSIKQHNI